MSLKACTTCGALSAQSRCARHRYTRPNAGKRGYGAKWRAVRAAFLRANPRCEVCGERARDVHHKDGEGPLGPLGYSPENLAALCHPHHSAITARQHLGGPGT